MCTPSREFYRKRRPHSVVAFLITVARTSGYGHELRTRAPCGRGRGGRDRLNGRECAPTHHDRARVGACVRGHVRERDNGCAREREYCRRVCGHGHACVRVRAHGCDNVRDRRA